MIGSFKRGKKSDVKQKTWKTVNSMLADTSKGKLSRAKKLRIKDATSVMFFFCDLRFHVNSDDIFCR